MLEIQKEIEKAIELLRKNNYLVEKLPNEEAMNKDADKCVETSCGDCMECACFICAAGVE